MALTTEELLRQAQAAMTAGREGDAIELLRRAEAQDAANPEPSFHLGNLLTVRGEAREAIAAYERALEAAPGHPDLLVNLGIVYGQAGDIAKAERCHREVLQRRPAHVGALGNLALSLFLRDEFAAALDAYDRLLATMPSAGAEVWNNRGVCQQRLGNRPGAEESFRRALALDPESAEIAANLGFLLYESRRYDAGAPLLHKASALDPGRVLVAAQALDVDLQLADWGDFERRRDAILAAVASFGDQPRQSVPPYLLLSLCDDPRLQLAAARRWAWPESRDTEARRGALRQRGENEPLRIGFVSSAFHEHPVSRLLAELLERIDRTRFRVHAYALGRGAADALRGRIERVVGTLTELGHMPTSAMVERVRADGIDVLFDLTGHTGQARPDLFAARPTPIQVSYLGYAGTLGASYYDFVVTDAYTTPPSAENGFVERCCRIGECYIPSDTRQNVASPPPARADYGLPGDAFVLISQAAPYKILPPLFDVWMRLLRSIPDALLWLRPLAAAAQANLRAEADRRGVDPRRVLFAPNEPVPRYLARYVLADLYLDTHPFGSHTTVNDALLAGLPVLTLAGRSMATRASAAQVRAAGLPELVAASTDEYESIARDLARDRGRLRALTNRLRNEGRSSALFDMERYARAFEAAVEAMWSEISRRHDAADTHPDAGAA
jgi:protein O-GlcNAc transferase